MNALEEAGSASRKLREVSVDRAAGSIDLREQVPWSERENGGRLARCFPRGQSKLDECVTSSLESFLALVQLVTQRGDIFTAKSSRYGPTSRFATTSFTPFNATSCAGSF